MVHRLRHWFSLIVLLLFSLPLLAHNVVAAQISAQPAHGLAGTSVTVSGTGWPAGDLIEFSWNFNYQLTVARVNADNSGKFTTSITVPQGTPPGLTYLDAGDQTAFLTAQVPFCVGQTPIQFEVVCYDTFSEGPLVYFRLFFTDPKNIAVGFGFKGTNGFPWREESHPFSSPSYGRVFPGGIAYPFNHLCGTTSAYESDAEAWIYDNAGRRSEPVTIHFACSNDFRNEVLNRARTWLKAGVPYNQNASRNGYRTDCSGFVSYAWQIKNNNGQPLSPTTVVLGSTYTTKLTSSAALKPGDIINNDLEGNDGHVVIFVNWTDQGRTKFIAYDEHYVKPESDPGATRYELTIGNGFTLFNGTVELDAPSSFHPERYIMAP